MNEPLAPAALIATDRLTVGVGRLGVRQAALEAIGRDRPGGRERGAHRP